MFNKILRGCGNIDGRGLDKEEKTLKMHYYGKKSVYIYDYKGNIEMLVKNNIFKNKWKIRYYPL